MAWIQDVIFDCAHPASLARFWAEALDGYRVAPYDEAERERLRAKGILDTEDDPTVLVEPVGGGRPRMFFQLVPEHRTVKNRVHLDLGADDIEAERERLTGLGATILAVYDGHTTLADPEGNEFCLGGFGGPAGLGGSAGSSGANETA
ncbi:VOC family protein [Phytomonospora endophytica]|uniref:Glyoxalase-like domain-containing protein n=1 Tax=Phytomonospora endophytica TaxID=714109 RepID=A0A841FPM5_9ACTN|nr:VOC family protein [Phytomonospora endophytica]MBB6039261.1 hypothetical protein [Phytomonospora endophytica]GIG69797.1 hypothetical protein Pen01_60920 [Phytomonospora endophytica]